MAEYKIGILNGDDIGLEIVPVAVEVLKTAVKRYPEIQIEWVPLPIGYPSFLEHGTTLLPEVRERLYTLDGWILGPIGHMAYPKDQPNCFNPHPILRREYDLVSNIRPAKSYAEIPCINPNVDLVIIRENNEGFQPDRNMFRGTSDCMPTPDMALSLRVITRRNSTLVAREGFELARRRGGRKKVTAVHKNTVFKLGCGLFIEACRDVAKEYPDIEFETVVVDTFAMKMLMRPQDYDVVITTNMFGDILSDEAAGLVGGLGMAAGLCAGPQYCMAQATHGSAPDIAGKGIANPFAMIKSAQMMLNWLAGRKQDASALKAAAEMERAMEAVLSDKASVTPDLGGTASTLQMGRAVCGLLEAGDL
ncbi:MULTISPECIES: isocitrate/isopropylmalate dehydrogenase family protein [Anaerotruncus]|uniref:isocitrate/isopropylmalate dehydrogenase family protein n=1 Tax=Anaerotruncus TaxID=244127 RepID=UPI00208A0DE9|nr:isocitrate/isopropylmalate family dehydrogenase [Anaerotruncus massiliensis (ex Togo et al. 2019)]GKH47063.1 3-isopropylmalate dehydrogenase [Oscillospiraceae bacterium]